MTNQEIRRENTQLIIDEMFGGKKAGLAQCLGKDANSISRYFSDAKDGRRITDEAAREIEEKCDKPIGWLDWPHSSGLDPELSGLIRVIDQEGRHALKMFLRSRAIKTR